jgi:predicted nucleotidyltransferase
MKVTDAQMSVYRAAARQRQQQKAHHLAARQQRAWQVAQLAAQLLRNRFGVQRVVVFGSVLSPERFHERSDVDLAVWGLADRDYYRAVAKTLSLDPGISVDLIQGESASERLLTLIEREGKCL